MKKILLTAAALVALAAPAAQAVEVGTLITFNRPTPLAAGCSVTRDAVYVKQMWDRRDFYQMRDFVEWINKSRDESRSCMIFNESPDSWWRVVKRDTPQHAYTGKAWHCLESKYDYRTDVNQPNPCYWIWLNDR
jgi:hypothetical protein